MQWKSWVRDSSCRFMSAGGRWPKLTLNQRVPGSSPGAPTNKNKDLDEIPGAQGSRKIGFGHAFGHTPRGTPKTASAASVGAARFHAGIEADVAKERTMRHAHAIAKPRQATSALGSIGTRSRRTRNQEKQRRPRDLRPCTVRR